MARPHWLRPATKHSTPGGVLCFDTETHVRRERGVEVLTLRCWDALLRVRCPGADTGDMTRPFSGETAGELADAVETGTAATRELWVFAHNLGFDLTVTSLPAVLMQRGWDAPFVHIGEQACMFVFRQVDRRLVVTDAWSWLHCSLQSAAQDVGMRKTRLPAEDEGLARWHQRCAHDVAILDRLVQQLLDWWDQQKLGPWGLTGAACGWRSLRHRTPAKRVLVGTEAGRTDFERAALYGGRKEVYQVGRVRGRWVENWDVVTAHLTTLARLPLPRRPLAPGCVNPMLDPLYPPVGLGALCRVEVVTNEPCAPVRIDRDVWWPVGTFRTVLSTPELQVVSRIAREVRVLETSWYELSMDLASWGRWCLGLVDGSTPDVPRVVRRVAKGWGRSVPGRFALRRPQLISEREATHLGWALETGVDLRTGHQLEVLTFGGIERTYRKDLDGADVSPVVLAFVEGYVRAAMARILRARDPALLLQCNTDGWWEVRQGRSPGDADASVPAPYRAARKAVTRDVVVQGPNHMDTPSGRRLAGVPVSAEHHGNGVFSWQDWPGLRWQLQHSRPGEYIRPGREVTLAKHYCRRWVLNSGETVPVSAAVGGDGTTLLLPWCETALRRPGDVLAELQVPALAERALAGPVRASTPPTGSGPLPGRRRPATSASAP